MITIHHVFLNYLCLVWLLGSIMFKDIFVLTRKYSIGDTMIWSMNWRFWKRNSWNYIDLLECVWGKNVTLFLDFLANYIIFTSLNFEVYYLWFVNMKHDICWLNLLYILLMHYRKHWLWLIDFDFGWLCIIRLKYEIEFIDKKDLNLEMNFDSQPDYVSIRC